MEIGDYVRTKQKGFQPPQIAKIKSMKRDAGYNNQYFIELDRNLIPSYEYHIYEEDIAKTSPNIIDLIEIGDYVNGHRVNFVDGDRECFAISFGDDFFTLKSNFNGDIYWLSKEDIKSIVTKEMYSSVEYRVENN